MESKKTLSGSHIEIRNLIPQLRMLMESGYVPFLTDQGLPESARMQ